MQQLKHLRESLNYTQKDLAAMLQTTQQTIARWESGQAEPNLSALRDLALIFSTSVDALLGVNPLKERSQTTAYHRLVGDEQDGFWGHLGLKLDTCTKWYPITASIAGRICSQLKEIDADEQWISFSTLANKYVAFRPTATHQIWLLDDACDPPKEEWGLDVPYEGLPLEVYRAFALLNELSLTIEEWEAAYVSLPKETASGEIIPENEEVWESFCREVAKKLGPEVSERFVSVTAMYFCELKLYDPEAYIHSMCSTNVFFTNGKQLDFIGTDSELVDFITSIEDELRGKMANFSLTNEEDCFFPLSRLSVVEMPLIDILGAMAEE